MSEPELVRPLSRQTPILSPSPRKNGHIFRSASISTSHLLPFTLQSLPGTRQILNKIKYMVFDQALIICVI